MNKKMIRTLYDSKQYDLVIKYAKDNLDPEVKLLGLSALLLTSKEIEAINFINENFDIIYSKYPLKLMRAHFELLLKNKLFKDARKALEMYENKPYVSQEAEEFMKQMHDRIESEEHPNVKSNLSIDEINEILETSVNTAQLSTALFSLQDFNFSSYVSSLINVLVKKDIHPSLRTYALIVLVDNKYDKKVSFLSKDKYIELIPSKMNPPFKGENFEKIVKLLSEKNEQNITLEATAFQLLNYYTMDIYPSDINSEDSELISDALILLAKEYMGIKSSSTNKKAIEKKEEIKQIINSTPALEL